MANYVKVFTLDSHHIDHDKDLMQPFSAGGHTQEEMEFFDELQHYYAGHIRTPTGFYRPSSSPCFRTLFYSPSLSFVEYTLPEYQETSAYIEVSTKDVERWWTAHHSRIPAEYLGRWRRTRPSGDQIEGLRDLIREGLTGPFHTSSQNPPFARDPMQLASQCQWFGKLAGAITAIRPCLSESGQWPILVVESLQKLITVVKDLDNVWGLTAIPQGIEQLSLLERAENSLIQAYRALNSPLVREATPVTPPFRCSKAELLRALEQHHTYIRFLDELVDDGKLKLEKIENSNKRTGYLASFTDSKEHGRIFESIKLERQKKNQAK